MILFMEETVQTPLSKCGLENMAQTALHCLGIITLLQSSIFTYLKVQGKSTVAEMYLGYGHTPPL